MTSPALSACGQLGRPAGSTIHGVDLLQPWQVRSGKDLPAQLRVVAVQPYDQWDLDVLTTTAQ
jgi:hypothetical protein